MKTSLREIVYEWGPLSTALICMIGGFCHAWVCSVGTRKKKTITYLILIVIVFTSLGASLELSNLPDVRELPGQFIARIVLGGFIPMYAGIGIFAWCKPELLSKIAEDRNLHSKK